MSEIVELLNQQLATYIDLKLQLKQAHWNVKGPNFIGLHELFDDAAGQVDGWCDTIAERARALGGEACGTIDDVSASTLLKPYTVGVAPWDRHVAAIMAALDIVSKSGRQAIQTCLGADDQATADVFIELVRGVDKLRYLIGSHV